MMFSSIKTCPFCSGLLNGTRRIVKENVGFVVIEARFKVADSHFLVLPRAHVQHEIGLRNRRLLNEVKDLMMEMRVERCIVHPRPFNSVEHFHVHGLSGDFVHAYRAWSHSGRPPFSLTLDHCIANASS